MSLEMTKLDLMQVKDALAEARTLLSSASETYQQVSTTISGYGEGTGRSEHGEAVTGFQKAANGIGEVDSAIIQAESAIETYISVI